MTDTLRKPSPRWPIRVLGLAAACLLFILTTAGPAAAHTTLIATDPADGAVLAEAPDEVALTFNEHVSLPRHGIQLFDARGEPVPSSASASDAVVTVDLPEALSEGTYVVVWRVISADGHPVAGSLTFSIGEPSAAVLSPAVPAATDSTVTTTLSAVQAVSYLGLLLAAGLAIFTVLVLPADAGSEGARQRMRLLLAAAATTSVAAALLALPLTAINQQGIPLARFFSSTGWSGIQAEAIVSFAMMAVGLAVLSVAAVRRLAPRPSRVMLGIGVALAAVAPAITGHSRGYEPQLLLVIVDGLHVVAGSVWFGGLVGLALTVPANSGHRGDAARALSRFSTLAAGVLAVLVAAGLLLSWRIVGSWENLFGTSYGWLLLTKIALVAIAATIAAWNRYVLLPRTQRTAVGDEDEHRGATAQLGRVVSVEAVVIVMALVFTGFLVNQSPEADAQEAPDRRASVQHTQLGEDVEVIATLDPARIGHNTLMLQLEDPAGTAWKPPRPPAVSIASDELDLGRIATVGEAPGTFRADLVIPATGTWRVQVSLRLSEFENPVATVDFTVDEHGTGVGASPNLPSSTGPSMTVVAISTEESP